jgi:ABC-type multidrug transport system ATPase subunit
MSTPERLPEDSPAAIEVRGLTRRFRGRPALAGLSLTVRPGDICGLVGSNGGGKSTTLRLLAGLLNPDGGEGSVVGHDLCREAHLIRRKVGYLAQHSTLYSTLSVHENLRFRASIFGLRRPASVAQQQIRAFGLEEFRSTAVGRLSGGWSRQVQLAAALIHYPRLLLLDEPTVGLDTAARNRMWRALTGLAIEHVAIVLSTHDPVEAGRCSQILLLSDGSVRGRGSPADIFPAGAGLES